MWSKIDSEISSVKDQLPTKHTLKDIIDELTNVVEGGGGPGLLVNVHQATKCLYPMNFTGINLIANKKIGEFGKYNFNINLDPTGSEFYCPFNSYLTRETKRYYDQKNYAGFSSMSFQQNINNELQLSVCASVQHVKSGIVECVLDYFGKKFTSTLSLSYSDVSKAEVTVQHLHEINDKISVGAEVILINDRGTVIDSKGVALVGRYVDKVKEATASVTTSLQGVQLCLFKQLSPQIKVGSTIDTSFQNKTVMGSLSCEVADKEFTLRSSVDSNGCLVANLIKNHYYNGNIVFKPTISVLCNIQKQVKLGVGFELIV